MHALVYFLTWFVSAATAQYQFLVPDGAKSDFSESWTIGETMQISWSKGWHGVGKELSSADLWITWFRSDSYSLLLLEDVKFDKAGSLSWKINVTSDVVEEDDEFVLRLKPHAEPPLYTSTENESPSRGFKLIVGDTSLSSTSSFDSSTTSPPSSTFSTLASTTFVPGMATPYSNDGSEKSKNILPIVGGVVGGLVFFTLLGVIVILLLRLAKKKKTEEEGASVKQLEVAGFTKYEYAHDGEITPTEIQAIERPAEMDDGRRVHELGGQDGRGGKWN